MNVLLFYGFICKAEMIVWIELLMDVLNTEDGD